MNQLHIPYIFTHTHTHTRFNYALGYITSVLEDAKVYSEHAHKKEVDVSDVKLAVQNRMDHSFTTPPPRDVRLHEHNYYIYLCVCVLCMCVHV